MSIIIDDTLSGNLTFNLASGEEKYIQVNSNIYSCILSTKMLDSGATFSLKSAMESSEFIKENNLEASDIQWENIKIEGIEYTEVTVDILSITFLSPSILYFKNTSATQIIRFSLRGIR